MRTKRARPSAHTRRIKTKNGYKKVKINPGIKRAKRRKSLPKFNSPAEEMEYFNENAEELRRLSERGLLRDPEARKARLESGYFRFPVSKEKAILASKVRRGRAAPPMSPEEREISRNLQKSIQTAWNRKLEGSDVEDSYIKEKEDKLNNFWDRIEKTKRSSSKKSILKDVFSELMATDESVGMYGTGDYKQTEKFILGNKNEMELLKMDGISKKDIQKYADKKQKEWEDEQAEMQKAYAEIYMGD